MLHTNLRNRMLAGLLLFDLTLGAVNVALGWRRTMLEAQIVALRDQLEALGDDRPSPGVGAAADPSIRFAVRRAVLEPRPAVPPGRQL